MTSYLDKPWPRVTWDQDELIRTARAVRLMGLPTVFGSDEDGADHIRSTSETMLYREGQPEHGMSCATGGWSVVFVGAEAPGHYRAWPSVSSYSAMRYAEAEQRRLTR
jgi:hypothetical protein